MPISQHKSDETKDDRQANSIKAAEAKTWAAQFATPGDYSRGGREGCTRRESLSCSDHGNHIM